MPVKFDQNTNNLNYVRHYKFSFPKYFTHALQSNQLQKYAYLKEFRTFWINKLLTAEEKLKKTVKLNPNYNPLATKPLGPKGRYETYCFEFTAGHGESYFFTFDVNEMDNYLNKHALPSKTLDEQSLYYDPMTPYIPGKLNDVRTPYFGRMFGIPKMYLTVDGSHRIKARVVNGEKKFEGYIFEEDTLHNFLVFDLDKFLYLALYEIQVIGTLISYGVLSSDYIKQYIINKRKNYL